MKNSRLVVESLDIAFCKMKNGLTPRSLPSLPQTAWMQEGSLRHTFFSASPLHGILLAQRGDVMLAYMKLQMPRRWSKTNPSLCQKYMRPFPTLFLHSSWTKKECRAKGSDSDLKRAGCKQGYDQEH